MSYRPVDIVIALTYPHSLRRARYLGQADTRKNHKCILTIVVKFDLDLFVHHAPIHSTEFRVCKLRIYVIPRTIWLACISYKLIL